ncbi:hypothetical protein [Vulcanisaeta distributa]|uniref:Uncharacterized protein n=1 Tax=Vulcanisaeta distributa (strain DSM 14429 / JCM 11212 / NBRC 100878 / IC-017) TaxID=572478 RepID=E1QQF4_VULDI|nr:hypothetical protein [Vulcanisaeta distributa]ADN50449.1 hypothetical protein Vdis_1061 [Vulcanisaeta distributa DSM 14429]
MQLASNCGLVIKEHRADEVKGGSTSLFVDLSMADYVELVIRDPMRGIYIHYPYRVIYTRDGDLLLIRAESYGDNRLRRHKSSVCPFRDCRYLLGPLANTRFVVRIVGIRNADPVIRFT